MTSAMQELLERVAKMPEDEQEQFARWLLSELAAEERWDRLLAQSSGLLRQMANDAVAEYERGLTEPLDPDAL